MVNHTINNNRFCVFSGILLDDLALRYYMEELQDAIQDLYIRRNAIKNSETSYGILFPYDKQHNTTNAKWSSFLSGFFKQNQDNLDVLVELAMRELPNQVTNTFRGLQEILFYNISSALHCRVDTYIYLYLHLHILHNYG